MVSSVLAFDGSKTSSSSSSADNKIHQSTSSGFGQSSSLQPSSNTFQSTNVLLNDASNDQISLLFPKCRPRNDVNLNHLNSNGSLQTATASAATVTSFVTSSATNSNIVIAQSPPTSSLSSSESSQNRIAHNLKLQKSLLSRSGNTNTTTNPFLMNSSSTSSFNNQQQQQYSMNDEHNITLMNDNSNICGTGGGVMMKGNLKNSMSSSNIIDGMTKYSQKRPNHIGPKYSSYATTVTQQSQYQNQHQNPFMKDTERSIWELRTTVGKSSSSSLSASQQQQHQQQQHYQIQQHYNNISSSSSSSHQQLPPSTSSSSTGITVLGVGGGIESQSSVTASNNTTPCSTVLNSPDLIEMETKMNFSQKNNQYNIHHHHSTPHPHHQIKLGRSPVNSNSGSHAIVLDSKMEQQQQKQQLNNKNMNLINDGEVVVFDDIGENYLKGKKNGSMATSASTSRIDVKGSMDGGGNDMHLNDYNGAERIFSPSSTIGQIPDLYKCVETSKKSSDYEDLRNSSGIIEYEGSPRKFGQNPPDLSVYTSNTRSQTHQQPPSSLFPPRPGYPQRVVNTPINHSTIPQSSLSHSKSMPIKQTQHQQRPASPVPVAINPNPSQQPIHNIKSDLNSIPSLFSTTSVNQYNNTDDTSNDISEICNTSEFTNLSLSDPNKKSTFDYLYEFSETRKVLEEFFKCPSNDDDDKTLGKFSDFNDTDDLESVDNNVNYEYPSSATMKLDSTNNETMEKTSDYEKNEYDHKNDMEILSTSSYIGQRLANKSPDELNYREQNMINTTTVNVKENGYCSEILRQNDCHDLNEFDLFLDSASRSSGEICDNDDILKNNSSRRHSRCFPYSPETTDYDSNCGDLDSEVSLRLIGSEFGLSGEFNNASTYTTQATKFYTSMPVLEDGLSSGHASDTENNNNNNQTISILMDNLDTSTPNNHDSGTDGLQNDMSSFYNMDSPLRRTPTTLSTALVEEQHRIREANDNMLQNNSACKNIFKNTDPDLESLYSIRKIDIVQLTPPPPAPAPHRKTSIGLEPSSPDIQAALKDIRTTLQRTKTFPSQLQPSSISPTSGQQPSVTNSSNPIATNNSDKLLMPDSLKSPLSTSPIWVPRLRENSGSLESMENPLKNISGDEDEADTDLETDRLLGHQRLDDMGFYDEKSWLDRDRNKTRSLLSSSISKLSPKLQTNSSTLSVMKHNNGGNGTTSMLRTQNMNSILPTTPEINQMSQQQQQQQQSQQQHQKLSNNLVDIRGPLSSPEHDDSTPNKIHSPPNLDDSPNGSNSSNNIGDAKKKTKSKEVLIEGVLFRARYLGSTQLVCEGQPTKSTRMIQAEEAVSRIKSPDGETQPSTEVDLFISTEKIMVLNTDLKEIMMDHALRTISYIADIGDLVVLMARRRFVPAEMEDGSKPNRTPKMICHVFESEEAQFIAQSIGQAFQVAYMEFLKANGIEDHSFVKEMDYQEVLNSQEIFGDELEIFAKKELQKEVVVPKAKGEILGVVIVESGWGSMLPTVVIANLLSTGAAARCGQLNIGDQIIAINGLSLVGLPLSTCQTYIKNTKNQTVVKFTVVPCAPVVEVKIKRPNTKYQLGFSVQNGVICSLLRGGIAERGGVRVGHRIIEINNQSVVAVPHEKIVNLLATSVGEILMKTMPTSMFRLLTGQENPIYI